MLSISSSIANIDLFKRETDSNGNWNWDTGKFVGRPFKISYTMTSAVNNGEKHLVDFIRQPDGKSLGILGQVT